jgi:hydroxysqualene dehydroxylase
MTGARGADVCVVGGGLAGITAAVRLAEAGMRVTLLESRWELGGMAGSIRRGELVADTGQHVFLRCYSQYRAMLERLGSTAHTELQNRFSVPVLVPGGARHVLVRGWLPAPLHLLGTLCRYRLLRPAERLAALRAAAALRHVDPDAPAHDAVTFGSWLAAHDQSTRVVRCLWDLVAVAALNVGSAQAPLGLAARVFRTGLLDRADAGDIGRYRAPLARVHGEAARQLLDRLGARVLTRCRVGQIEPGERGFTVSGRGTRLRADGVVLAVPHRVAAGLVPPGAAPDRGRWRGLGSSPIVNVHIRYDHTVTDLPFAAAVDSPVQWIFDRTEPDRDRGQYLVVSLSAADAHLTRPAGTLVAEQLAALGQLFPAARRAPVRDAFVTREPHATFRPVPGIRALRPGPTTALPGLALAGAWTATGWPDTMEGAVRSGQRAADVVAGHLSASPSARKALS